jgi:hypothetical protein
LSGVEIDEHGRPLPEMAADEVATLLGFLDFQRATLAWKCGGLDAAGLQATVGMRRASVPPSARWRSPVG